MSKPKLERNINVPLDLIKELLTPSEQRMIKQRLLIIQFLEQGLSVRAIAQQVGVGTDTVVRMSRKLESSPLLRQIFKKQLRSKLSSKWIFGKSDRE